MPTTELEPAPAVNLTLMPRADTLAIFAAFEQQAAALLTRADSIKVTDISQKQEMAEARRVRLSLREIRITMEKRRVEMVEDMTKETKRINSTAKLVKDGIESREEYLQLQEQFAERWQRAEDARILTERTALLREVNGRTGADIGILSEEEFAQVLADATQLDTLRKQQAEQAELYRLQQVQKEAEERERVRLENIRLKEESDKAAAEAKAERDRLQLELRAEREATAAREKEAQQERDRLRAEVDADNRRRDAETAALRREADAMRAEEERERAAHQAKHDAKLAQLQAEIDATKERERAAAAPTPEPVKAAPALTVTHPASFAKPASRYSLDEKIAVLGRELGMRRRVYPQRVERGEMLQEQATFQTEVMAEILAEYHAQKAASEPDLFASL